ncbi:ABC-2 family transporter protein [Posidoniimonas polymericola]|uniref:ABC-2 family transporter protein n=1 Tax=Posidoniimonas polymericola TaxID=2528002 RepID=A0A5C5YTE2_9BACT|nr:ABC transporter permease subunit [Posidoniimonas polymericola]TWT78071.1 ABC-2 family transporter protein [Posidoniimonas polymericola]
MNAALANPIAPAAPDTLRLAKRFFWKELRMQSGLAVGTAVSTLLVMLIYRASSPISGRPDAMAVLALGAAALFCVAAAVTLFSVEREEGTMLYLQSLPENRWATLLGKLTSAIVLTPLLFGVLLAVGAVVAGGVGPSERTWLVLGTTGVVVLLELLVWSLLASLLVPKPLLAACLGIAGASFCSFATIAATGGNVDLFELGDSQALPARLVVALLIGALDVWLGLNWLPRGEQHVTIKTTNRAKEKPAARANVGWLGSFGRLAWQTHRQSWKSAFAATVIGGCLTLAWPLVLGMAMGMDNLVRETPRPAILLGALFVPALMGALVFREDQRRRQHRFLAEHAAPPRRVWLARQVVGLGYLTLMYCGIAITLFAAAAIYWRRNVFGTWIDLDQQDHAGWTSGFLEQVALTQQYDTTVAVLVGVAAAAFAAYAVGQFFSLTLRSEIFAGLLAFGAAWLLAGWAMLVFYWMLSPLWAVAPFGLAALLATWLRAPAWLFERGGVKPWLLPAVVLTAPLAFVMLAVPAARDAQLAPRYQTHNLPNGEAAIAAMAANARAERSRGREVADGYTLLKSGGTMDSDALQEFIRLSKIDCRLPPSPLKKTGRTEPLDELIQQALRLSEPGRRLEVLLACRRANVQRLRGRPGYAISWDPPRVGYRPGNRCLGSDRRANQSRDPRGARPAPYDRLAGKRPDRCDDERLP